jgi:arylsulfatase
MRDADAPADATKRAPRGEIHTRELAMADQVTTVLVCAYPTVETADSDFETLMSQVKGKQVGIQAAILISQDADGEVAVQRTGDSLGRKGMGWGGGVGFLVGLAAPPLLAATAVGLSYPRGDGAARPD